ncbi:MAG: thermonuclease family protein [Zhengella sp.]|uniref:thermonuclease family protein n=1 Tax=Zhengella sp. TaxID=2282762 RepID=UPI001DF95B91|nr:thermonuclease family protein [Notoacmeibacter sp.]
MLLRLACPVLLFCHLFSALPAAAQDTIRGPVEAEVIRVIDGDSVLAVAQIWPGHSVTVSVRIRGVDAPELRGRCGAEKAAARKARDSLAGFLQDGHLRLTNISGGKYYGRVLADLARADGRGASAFLLEAGLARPYGGGRRQDWCP